MKRSLVPRVAASLVFAALVSATSMTASAASGPSSPTIINPPIGFATPGPVLNLAVVPNCLGMTRTGCENLLISSGLRLGTVTLLAPQGPGPFIGSRVVSQSPAAGTFVRRGAAVNISIQPFGPPQPI